MLRRNFLKSSAIFTAGMYASNGRAIAGPFLPNELGHNIPIDKKLNPEWLKSLSKRGFVTKYLKSKKFSYQPLLLREYPGRHDPSLRPIKYKRIHV
jgi:hypothetical protein